MNKSKCDINIFERPGNNKILVDKIVRITKELRENGYFTVDVERNISKDIYFHDVFALFSENDLKSFIIHTCLDGYITILLFATKYNERNLGYGKYVYKRFEEYYIEKGYNKYLLQTRPPEVMPNNDTIEFYKKIGYKITKIYTELWENGCIEMTKEI
jgi:ribosomal protein S18 acetylase RimI-like enzyme